VVLGQDEIDPFRWGVTVCLDYAIWRYYRDISTHHGAKGLGCGDGSFDFGGRVHNDTVLVKEPKPFTMGVNGHGVASSWDASPSLDKKCKHNWAGGWSWVPELSLHTAGASRISYSVKSRMKSPYPIIPKQGKAQKESISLPLLNPKFLRAMSHTMSCSILLPVLYHLRQILLRILSPIQHRHQHHLRRIPRTHQAVTTTP